MNTRATHKLRLPLLALATLTLLHPAFAQLTTLNQDPNQPPAARVPEFDVVSVKLNTSGTTMMRSGSTPDGISVSNAPLLMLIRQAYGLFNSNEDRISGVAGWVKDDRFDIEAKVAGPDVDALHKLNRDQRSQMLQALLADRFNLKVHRETRELPIYSLVIAKGGLKLKQSTPGDTYPNGIKGPDGASHAGMLRVSSNQITAQAIPISNLISTLTQITGRTVLDKTGLIGNYDIALTWTPEDTSVSRPRSTDAASPPPPTESGPSIFTAIQEQLGLRLEPGKGPVEGLAIDHVEMPSKN